VIYELTTDDVDRCGALAIDRGWLPEAHKWRLLLEIGQGYGIDDETGRLIGSVIVTRYDARLSAISMVLVAADREGRGLGRRLMQHAIAQAGTDTISLYATERGRPLYESLGFRTVVPVDRHAGFFAHDGHEPVSRPATPAELPGICALDAPAFGADRSALLRRLSSFGSQLRVLTANNIITGYGGAWRNDDNTVIGPLVAASPDDARHLIADLAANVAGPIRLDLDDHHPELQKWATAHGVEAGSRVSVMVYGLDAPGDAGRRFLPVMQALG
jgi:GNAT superfamily N-acetyltransferase